MITRGIKVQFCCDMLIKEKEGAMYIYKCGGTTVKKDLTFFSTKFSIKIQIQINQDNPYQLNLIYFSFT